MFFEEKEIITSRISWGEKMGCAPRARTLPCAPCRNAVDLQSNGERAERLGLHTNAARLPQIGFHAHPLSAFSAQFATTRPRLPRQLSDRGTEVPRGLISYGRRHRSPSCRAGRRSAGAPRSGRQEEEDARLRRPSATYSSHPGRLTSPRSGRKGVAAKPYRPVIVWQHGNFICDQRRTLLVGSSTCPLRRGRPRIPVRSYAS